MRFSNPHRNLIAMRVWERGSGFMKLLIIGASGVLVGQV